MSRTNPLTPEYGWNERASRYVNLDNGRFVSSSVVKGELENVITSGQISIEFRTQALLDGNITAAEWRAGMLADIKTMHVAAAASARGGWAQMTPTDWGWTGSQIKKQYQYLERFAQDIVSGKQPLNGRLMVRAKLYGQAGRGTFEEMRRRMAYKSGQIKERRVLGHAEHCGGCKKQASLGWQPIGTLDPIGAEECLTNCQCTFEYRGLDGILS